jgi:hypothetical protein
MNQEPGDFVTHSGRPTALELLLHGWNKHADHGCKRLIVLHAGVEGPCLHRPEIYKVGFIREKGKATAREA